MEQNNGLTVSIKNSIEHKTFDIKGCEINYYISGGQHKNSILFLHPAFSDHTSFDQQIDCFSDHYKVITLDLIGHGLSQAKKSKDKIDNSVEHIFQILEAEKINQIHIVGVSMGSLIAQYFALQYPNKTLSLAALGGYDINKKTNEIEKAQRGTNLGLIFRAVFSMKAFRRKTAKLTCQSQRGQALFYKSTNHYERKSFRVMQGLKNVIQDREDLEIKYPVLIITGEFDIDLAQKMAKVWHNNSENSEYYTLKNGGHCAHLDEPLLFNKKVKEFIDKNSK